MTEIIGAKIIRPVMVPYSKQELDSIPPKIVRLMQSEGMQKVIDEEVTITKTNNTEELREELRYRVVDLCSKYRPYPILVKLDNTTLNRTFIADRLSDVNDRQAILEIVFFTYNDKGKGVEKLIQQRMQEYDEQWHKIIAESGIDQREIWSVLPILHTRSNVPRDLFEYRIGILDADKQTVVKRILDIRNNIFKKTCSELAEKFGISKQFTYDYPLPDLHPNPYLVSARQNGEEQLLDLTTVLYEFIEERGRVISIGHRFGAYEFWFKKWHPELLQPDVLITHNSTHFDGPHPMQFNY